jgi:hypothetical protein
MRFEMVFGARTAKEVNNLRLFIHGVVTSGTPIAVPAFWMRDAKALASSDALASCYCRTEPVPASRCWRDFLSK